MNFDYEEYYKKQLEEGQKFQDHCAYWIYKRLNIGLVNFQTKEYQYKFGENLQGFEIKLDKVFETSGNLWIEIAERQDPYTPYSESGIFRKDNAWTYCIGNYDVLYLFSRKTLVGLYESGCYPTIHNNIMTSRGFLLPKSDAEKYASTKIITKIVVNESLEGTSDQTYCAI